MLFLFLSLSISLFADVSVAVNISPKYVDYTHTATVIRQIDDQMCIVGYKE